MSPRLLRAAVFACLVSLCAEAHATQLNNYLQLEGVPGESNPPGSPGAIAVETVGLRSGAFEVLKPIDSTSSSLALAEGIGTVYANVSLLFYDDLASDSEPDAALVLHTAMVSSISPATLGGSLAGESVSFSFASPGLSMFLELPGVTGESSAPGHSGLIALDSVSLSGNGFSVGKPVDSVSLPLATAEVLGTPYATVSILFYSNILSETQPDFSLVYQSVLVSSIVTSGGQEHPSESVSFAGAGVTVSHPVPEPAASMALLSAALFGAAVRRRW